MKGLAIMGVVIVHRILWDYFGLNPIPLDQVLREGAIFFLFASMGAFFFVASGAVNSYVIYQRLKTSRNTPKQLILGGLITGLSLIVFTYIQEIFLVRGLDDVTTQSPGFENSTSIIPYFILYGRLPDPIISPYVMINIGTLSMIGITVIFISILLGVIYSKWKTRFEDSQTIYYFLMFIGVLILVLTPFMRLLIGQLAIDAYESGNYLVAFFTIPLVNGNFPIFPHIAYGCFGAVIGINYARNQTGINEDSLKVKIMMGLLVVAFLVFGVINFKFPDALSQFQPVSWNDNVRILALKLIQLSFFLCVILLGMFLIDYRSEKTRERWVKATSWVNDFSNVPLTIYMFEGVLAVTLQTIVSLFWIEWNATFINAVLFGLINLLLWALILKLWKRADYKGSAEWFLSWIVSRLSGRKSSRQFVKEEKIETSSG
jgi:hypothetical protein